MGPLEFHSARTAREMRSRETNLAGPLRQIVAVEETIWGGAWELLECGHKGRCRPTRASAEFWMERGTRRRCAECGKGR